MVKQNGASITSHKLVDLGRRLLLVLLVLYILFLVGKVVYQNYQTKRRLAEIEAEIERLRQENRRLSDLVTYYQTDTFRELEARKKLGLKKPGETVVALPENADEEIVDPTRLPAAPAPPPMPNYRKWWEYLFGQ